MSQRLANLPIIVLLMFQLAFGVQWQVANAATPMPTQGKDVLNAEHCPTHQPQSSADEHLGAQTIGHLPSSPHTPNNKHDCCHSVGCQCQCTQSPAAIELSMVSISPASVRAPDIDSHNPAVRASDFFRPPIA